MRQIDLCFHYKYVGKFLLIQKTSELIIKSAYKAIFFKKLVLYISIKNLVDLDDLRCSNYAYLFRLFLGKRLFFANYSNRFHLNILYHSFNVQCIYRNRAIYFPLCFLLTDVLPILNREFLEIKKFENFVSYVIYDMHLFTEKKNNVGLFNLKDPLNYKFFLSGADVNLLSEHFLKIFKL